MVSSARSSPGVDRGERRIAAPSTTNVAINPPARRVAAPAQDRSSGAESAIPASRRRRRAHSRRQGMVKRGHTVGVARRVRTSASAATGFALCGMVEEPPPCPARLGDLVLGQCQDVGPILPSEPQTSASQAPVSATVSRATCQGASAGGGRAVSRGAIRASPRHRRARRDCRSLPRATASPAAS